MKPITLGSLVDVVRTPLPKIGSGSLSYVATGDLGEHELRGIQVHEYGEQPTRANLICKPGDVILARMANTTKVLVIDELNSKFIYSTGFAALRIKTNNITPIFLANLLRTKGFQREKDKACTGATQKAILDDALLAIEVYVPTLELQGNISDKFRLIDSILGRADKQLSLLEEYVGSVYHDIFEDFKPTKILSEVCTLITDGTHQAPKWSNEGVPFLFVSNITSGEIDYQTPKRISGDSWHLLFDKKPVDVGDILYSSVGSYGIPAQVRQAIEFGFQRHIAHLKLNLDLVDPTFMVAQLASPSLKRQADREVRGAAQPTLNLSSIRNFQVMVPPISLQREFAHRADTVRSGKESLETLRIHSLELRQNIETDLFEA